MVFAGCASGGSQRPTNDDLWGKSRSRQARSLSKAAAAVSTPIYKQVSDEIAISIVLLINIFGIIAVHLPQPESALRSARRRNL